MIREGLLWSVGWFNRIEVPPYSIFKPLQGDHYPVNIDNRQYIGIGASRQTEMQAGTIISTILMEFTVQ